MKQEIVCRFCGKKTSKFGIKLHERHCHSNPNYIVRESSTILRGKRAWNKGLTKENDPRIAKGAETFKKHYQEGQFEVWIKGLNKENSEKVRSLSSRVADTVSKKVINGDWHCSFSKARTIEYQGMRLHGSWELSFVKYLEKLNIEYERCKETFSYEYEDHIHTYQPDFYLPKLNLYIEIKGYPTNKDYAKWSQFPSNLMLDIYFGDELKELGIVKDARDVYQDVPFKYRQKHYILQ